jgi:hypothetical protein
MKNWRRYEILLPLRYNDGKRVPKPVLAEIVLDLENGLAGSVARVRSSKADGVVEAKLSVTI